MAAVSEECMSKAREQPTKSAESGPAIRCLPLPAFDASDLKAAREAFRQAVPCALGQAWLEKAEPDFAPALVRVGWRENSLLLFAELTDRDIFTRATAPNQRMWELGDTFEIFLGLLGEPSYAELHVTPNNLHLQLRFPDACAVAQSQRNGMDKYLMAGE